MVLSELLDAPTFVSVPVPSTYASAVDGASDSDAFSDAFAGSQPVPVLGFASDVRTLDFALYQCF